jgi:hypothetical protein
MTLTGVESDDAPISSLSRHRQERAISVIDRQTTQSLTNSYPVITTVLDLTACPELYFSAMDWHLSINACRSASLSKVGSTACIPMPEQFVEFASGAFPPPQLVKAPLSAIINTIYLDFIKFSLFKNQSST